ncbi:MAG TPA: hypothetical protein VIZ28_12930 [Chitinophagaceae bacterium]
MPLAKLITPKKTNLLGTFRILFSLILIALFSPAFSQDNSPYTRYGMGDIVPSTNVNSRGMGGISAGYNDFLSINFNNPASYGSFQAIKEVRSNKLRFGRAILDLGVNLENRTLRDPKITESFTASNALFSHLQVGVPLKVNWGLSFGLRPVTRISYLIDRSERIYDPNTNLPIDSVNTLYKGDGGSYMATMGIGHRISINLKQSISFGVNTGYIFGRQDYSARRSFVNDSVEYKAGNFQTKTNFGSLFFNMGMQYQVSLDSTLVLTFGAFGNLKHKFNATQDMIRETYISTLAGNLTIDSVFHQNDLEGEIEYPSSLTAGFTLKREAQALKGGWMIGVDFNQGKWSEYRFYGQTDSVIDKWELRLGGEIRPSYSAGRKSYLGNVIYRAGFFFGRDYIKVKDQLPVWGTTLGLGLPILSQNRFSPGQVTMVNLAFEFIRRGNNNNLLTDNMFRISIGFSLSDFWFNKKKYE